MCGWPTYQHWNFEAASRLTRLNKTELVFRERTESHRSNKINRKFRTPKVASCRVKKYTAYKHHVSRLLNAEKERLVGSRRTKTLLLRFYVAQQNNKSCLASFHILDSFQDTYVRKSSQVIWRNRVLRKATRDWDTSLNNWNPLISLN